MNLTSHNRRVENNVKKYNPGVSLCRGLQKWVDMRMLFDGNDILKREILRMQKCERTRFSSKSRSFSLRVSIRRWHTSSPPGAMEWKAELCEYGCRWSKYNSQKMGKYLNSTKKEVNVVNAIEYYDALVKRRSSCHG